MTALVQLLIWLGAILSGLFMIGLLGFRRGWQRLDPESSPEADASDQSNDDDRPISWLERLADGSERLIATALLLAIMLGVGWYFWPQLSSRFTIHADSTPVVAETSTAPSPTATDELLSQTIPEEETANWQTYRDTTNLFTLQYPGNWSLTALARTDQIQAAQKITSAFEIRPKDQHDPSHSPTIRVHVEENPDQQVASSFGSLHPARGSDRTPYVLHGMAAVKYKSVLLASKQNRWITYVEGGRNDTIVILEFLSPITLDTFDPSYTRAERIISTFRPLTATLPTTQPSPTNS